MDETSPRAFSLPELLQTEFGRRVTALVVALAIELLLLLALLSLSQSGTPPPETLLTEVDLSAQNYSEPAPEQPEPEPEQPRPDAPTTPQLAETPTLLPAPAPATVIPLPTAPRVPEPDASPLPSRPGVRMGPPQGPPNRRSSSSSSGDSQRVGTAPNGEPLYAARWYREPGAEFFGFLSTASEGSGLMACRTVPNFYVTDCVPLGDTPGSMLNRSMLAGSGQLRVRPAQVGGRLLVGSWVRIRITYTVRHQ